MANVKQMKASSRPKAGKGAARAERRAGRVPGVIYGDNQPPITVAVDLDGKALRNQQADPRDKSLLLRERNGRCCERAHT